MTNAEIQVGEYVRTTSGFIAKCIEKSNYVLTFDNTVRTSYGEPWDYLFPEDKYITNHDFNIIKLIEVGDYVNGERVIKKDKDGIYIGIETDYRWLDKKYIQDIVTKEQFNSMEYKVGGEK